MTLYFDLKESGLRVSDSYRCKPSILSFDWQCSPLHARHVTTGATCIVLFVWKIKISSFYPHVSVVGGAKWLCSVSFDINRGRGIRKPNEQQTLLGIEHIGSVEENVVPCT